jgi:hypothetical protein
MVDKDRRKTTLLWMFVITALSGCKVQPDSRPQQYHNKEFNWTINIPENFASVSTEEWAKLQNRGLEAVEKTYGEEVNNQTTTIFVFKNGDFNYLESNYQPFDPEADGDYLESCKGVQEIVFETFRSQMPKARIDTASSVERVSGLEFQTFKINLDLPNGRQMKLLMYSRLFGRNEFSVNITYMDEEQGEKMMEAWLGSEFD